MRTFHRATITIYCYGERSKEDPTLYTSEAKTKTGYLMEDSEFLNGTPFFLHRTRWGTYEAFEPETGTEINLRVGNGICPKLPTNRNDAADCLVERWAWEIERFPWNDRPEIAAWLESHGLTMDQLMAEPMFQLECVKDVSLEYHNSKKDKPAPRVAFTDQFKS